MWGKVKNLCTITLCIITPSPDSGPNIIKRNECVITNPGTDPGEASTYSPDTEENKKKTMKK